MSYPYSQINRLEEPHNYMYSPFQGDALLQSYQTSRATVLRGLSAAEHGNVAQPDHMLMTYALPILKTLFESASFEIRKKFMVLLKHGSERTLEQSTMEFCSLEDLAKGLEKVTVTESVMTLDLLHSLIAVQLISVQDPNIKVWLDRLVQRFEVTKKMHEFYPPGFRRGSGVNTSVRLYWLLSLSLSLFYARSNKMKYLSTLLKVCDLLCSLPDDALQGHIPQHGLSAVLATELISIQLLSEKKGILFATK